MLLDGSLKNIAKISSGFKSAKKTDLKTTIFSIKSQASEALNSSDPTAGAEVVNILLLQEIDQLSAEVQGLQEFKKRSIRCLRNLQIALLDGQLTENHLCNLKDVIVDNQAKFSAPELADLAQETILRMEVELAKIAANRKVTS